MIATKLYRDGAWCIALGVKGQNALLVDRFCTAREATEALRSLLRDLS